MNSDDQRRRALLVLCLAAVYVLWGSTYIAIRYAVETLPPFLMAGTRFLCAGLVLYGWVTWRARRTARAATASDTASNTTSDLGAPGSSVRARPGARAWRAALVCGALMMLGSNGLVCWAETRVDSAIAALVVSTVPLWMMTLDALSPSGKKPTLLACAGVGFGLVGVAVLAWPSDARSHVDSAGVLALVVATISWSIGSLYSRRAPLPKSPLLSTAMQMMCGGGLQLLGGLVLGEGAHLDLQLVSAKSVWAVLYLAVAGSLLGFSAYVWLLRNTTPAQATSYAFVNPLVAIVIAVIAGDAVLTGRTLVGAGIIVLGVVLVVALQPPRT